MSIHHRTKLFVAGIAICITGAIQSTSWASDAAPTDWATAPLLEKSRFSLLRARISEEYFIQSGSSAYTWNVSLDPSYRFRERLSFDLHVGFSMVRPTTGNLTMLDYGVRAAFDLTAQIYAEAGVGLNTWFPTGSSAASGFTATAGGGFKFPSKILFVLERIHAEYALILFSGATTHQIRLGVGLAL